jgi:AraC family transcriptional regulator
MRSAKLAAFGHRLHDELFATDLAAPLALEGGILEVLAVASRSMVNESSHTEPRWLRRVHELLHDQLGEPLALSQIANEVGVNASHVARTFRKRYGCTMGDYMRRLRIERASHELEACETPISAIALRAGFFDQSHFSKVFRRHTGMSPAEYRARVTETSS